MLLSLIGSNNSATDIIKHLLLTLPVIFLALSVHEAAHAFVSNKLGDPTAKNLGRLTLNPVKHLDPLGFLCMLLLGFGWAKPVPINTRYFKKPKRDMALSAFAGPVSNIIMALLFVTVFKILTIVLQYENGSFYSAGSELTLELLSILITFVRFGIYINIIYAIFNMLPIPPLDGSRVLYIFLPTKTYFSVMKYERYLAIGVMAVLILSNYILGINIISEIAYYVESFLFFIFRIS